jgi:hypothetical protein
MGCTHSTKQKVRAEKEGGGKIQDEARSYKSKVGAGKLVLKNEAVRVEFRKFIEKEGDEKGRTEFVTYFETLEQMKPLPREEQVLRIRKLLELTVSSGDNNNNRSQIASTLFSCLRPLRPLKLDKATHIEIAKALNATQDLLVSAVTPEFEKFMDSKEFAELKRNNLENNIAKKVKAEVPVKSQPIANKKVSTISPPKMDSGFHGVGL